MKISINRKNFTLIYFFVNIIMIVIALYGLDFEISVPEQYKHSIAKDFLQYTPLDKKLLIAEIFGFILYFAYIMRLKNIIGTFKNIKFWILFIVTTIFYGLQIYLICIMTSSTPIYALVTLMYLLTPTSIPFFVYKCLGLIFLICVLALTSLPFFMSKKENIL